MEKRSALFRTLLLVALLATPAALGLSLAIPGLESAPRLGWQGGAVFNIAELVLYFLGVLMVFPRAELITTAGLAMGLTLVRAAMCALAAGVISLYPESPPAAQAWILIWTGHIEMAVLEVALLLAVALPTLGLFFPTWVGEKPAGSARASGARGGAGSHAGGSAESAGGGGGGQQATLVGGYLQFNSYRDLEEFIEKTPSLLGYALATDEGLIVCSDGRQLPFPLEPTTPRLQTGMAELSAQQKRCGLSTELLWQVSPDYTIVYASLKPCFYLALFFAPGVALDDVSARVATIRKSAEAFLADRHSLLATAGARGEGEATAA